jgi:hypothetical protein
LKDSTDPDSYEVVEKGEVQNIHVSCGESEYWNSLKPGLESLNKRLNGAWGVNVIDRDGRTTNLAIGSNGTVTYKYSKTGNNWDAEISGISDSEVKQIITDAVNGKLSTFQIDETGKSKVVSTTVSSFSTEDGGEFRFGAGLHWYDWGPVLCDAGSSIWESSRLPETYWNQSNPKYNDYPLHTAPTFAGVSDGVIEEVTSVPQLVKLGLEITTDKEMATALWNSVKNINFSTIKEAATGAVKEKWDKYANSPNYITYHEIGKDGVQIASLLYGGFAAKGKKLSEAVEESGNVIKKRTSKFFNLPHTGFIKPKEVRFSQNNISSNFRDGTSIEDLVRKLQNKEIAPNSIPPIRIVEKDGLIYTLDNRRLKAFQDAEVDIPYEKLDNIPKDEMRKFTTNNEGISIKIRGGYDGND